jgi:hypothetical protein
MVLNSDGTAASKTNPNGDVNAVNGSVKKSVPMGKIASTMQSAPQHPKFETKEEEREWIKFRLAQGPLSNQLLRSSGL